jgi:hypothetical protein
MAKEIDEDLIEATIRRVAESKAAREAPAIEMPVAESIAPEVDPIEEEPAQETAPLGVDEAVAWSQPVVAAQPAEFDDFDEDIEVEPTPILAAARGRGIARPAAVAAREPAAWQAPPASGQDIARELARIQERLDTIMALLERLVGDGAGPSIGPVWERAHADTQARSEPERPAIFRDAAPRPLISAPRDTIDTRPIPEPLPPLQVEEKRGFDLLPRSYRITVEDKRRGVDLVPLHRALLGMDGVRDMSLLSYNNGIAIVALETTEELDPDALGSSVARVMSRGAKVEVHNEHTMVVKLADE